MSVRESGSPRGMVAKRLHRRERVDRRSGGQPRRSGSFDGGGRFIAGERGGDQQRGAGEGVSRVSERAAGGGRDRCGEAEPCRAGVGLAGEGAERYGAGRAGEAETRVGALDVL